MTRRIVNLFGLTLAFFVVSACAQMRTPPSQPVSTSHLQRILDRGELVVGTAGSMPPLNMTTRDAEVIGLEPDLARAMAKAMGVELRLKTMSFSELLPALQKGSVDVVLSGVTMTPQRNLRVAFVGPYAVTGKSVLTKKQTLAGIRDPAQINRENTTLAALRGSTSQSFVEELIPKATLRLTSTYEDAYRMVLRDQVDAVIADLPACVLATLRYPNQGLVTLAAPLTYEPVGIALPPDDPLLANWLANFLGILEGSGQLEALKAKWFLDPSWLNQLP